MVVLLYCGWKTEASLDLARETFEYVDIRVDVS